MRAFTLRIIGADVSGRKARARAKVAVLISNVVHSTHCHDLYLTSQPPAIGASVGPSNGDREKNGQTSARSSWLNMSARLPPKIDMLGEAKKPANVRKTNWVAKLGARADPVRQARKMAKVTK